jgi:hypothetical protein
LDVIDTSPYRIEDGKLYLTFEFKEYNSSSIRCIENVCKQLQEGLLEFDQKKYKKLNDNFEK